MTQPVITDVVDELIELPDEQKHLCTALTDEGEKPGFMRMLLNRDVLDIMQDIVDEIEMSRELPVSVREVNVGDPITLKILQSDKSLEARDAIAKAAGYYARQKQQVQNDALMVALTLYNELNIVPTPYKEGQIAFSVSGEDTTRSRKLPDWMKARESVELPTPERRLDNPKGYEVRLKQVYDMASACGTIWGLELRNYFEKGIAKAVRLAEPRDDANFPAKSSHKKVSKKSGADNVDAGDDA